MGTVLRQPLELRVLSAPCSLLACKALNLEAGCEKVVIGDSLASVLGADDGGC